MPKQKKRRLADYSTSEMVKLCGMKASSTFENKRDKVFERYEIDPTLFKMDSSIEGRENFYPVVVHLTSYEELLGIEDNQENSVDKITEIPIDCLYGFKNHPFHVINDEKMQETVDSIKEYGVLNPCIVRPREGGGYEIISGHRRKYACQLAGKAKIPAIIRN